MTRFDPHQTERLKALAGAELATFPARAAAFAIDLACASILFVLVAGPFEWLVLRRRYHFKGDLVFALSANWYSIVWVVAYFGIATYVGRGRTPGKALMRIRVISLSHPRITLWQAVERALGYGASLLELGFGFFQYFIHPNHQTVHDRIAETIVVRGGPDRDVSQAPVR